MNFIQGEQKEVRIKILSRKNQLFTIASATYELFKFGLDGTNEATGTASIDSDEIYTLVNPIDKGVYTLRFTYTIAAETFKADVQLEVR